MIKEYKAKHYDSASWWEKALLKLVKYTTHESYDGFVVYKKMFGTLYIYAYGHFIHEKPQANDAGYSKPWSN